MMGRIFLSCYSKFAQAPIPFTPCPRAKLLFDSHKIASTEMSARGGLDPSHIEQVSTMNQ